MSIGTLFFFGRHYSKIRGHLLNRCLLKRFFVTLKKLFDSPICILYPSIPIVIVVFKMKITYKGDYALKAVLDLALHYNMEPVTGPDIAK